MDFMTASGQRDRDRSRHRGFPHAPFPIVMTSPFPARLRSPPWRQAPVNRPSSVALIRQNKCALCKQRPQGFQTNQIKGFRYSIDRGRCARFSGMARKARSSRARILCASGSCSPAREAARH